MADSPDGLTYLCGGEIDAGEFSVSITSDSLDPEAITRLLGLQPTESHRDESGYGEWCVRTGRLDFRAEKSCEEQFDEFIRSLPADTDAWTRIAAEHRARAYIVVWMRTWNREFDISTFALGELARRRLRLHIDTYLDIDDDERKDPTA
jgi:hypothetical protein